MRNKKIKYVNNNKGNLSKNIRSNCLNVNKSNNSFCKIITNINKRNKKNNMNNLKKQKNKCNDKNINNVKNSCLKYNNKKSKEIQTQFKEIILKMLKTANSTLSEKRNFNRYTVFYTSFKKLSSKNNKSKTKNNNLKKNKTKNNTNIIENKKLVKCNKSLS